MVGTIEQAVERAKQLAGGGESEPEPEPEPEPDPELEPAAA